MPLPLLQLRHQQTAVAASPEVLAAATADFDRDKYLKLPAFVEPALLGSLLDELDRTEFYDRVHEGIGTELCAVPGLVSGRPATRTAPLMTSARARSRLAARLRSTSSLSRRSRAMGARQVDTIAGGCYPYRLFLGS